MNKFLGIGLLLFLSSMFSSLEAQRKIDKFSYIRAGGMIYRDSTVQRGATFRLDYVSNNFLSNQYYSVFVDQDQGIAYVQNLAFSNEPREFNNSRTDMGLVYGLNMVTNIKSRFYVGMGLGYSNYTFTDSLKEEPYEYSSIFYSYHTGAEVRLSKSNYLFFEYYVKRLPTRDNAGNAYEDSFELQQANVERWILGIAYDF